MKSVPGFCLVCAAAFALGPMAAAIDYEKAALEALKARRLAEVNRLCQEWVAAKPHDEKPRLILGRALMLAGMVEEAIEQFEFAAEANPLSPEPCCELGALFLRTGKPELAAKEFDAALRLDPDCTPAKLGKARQQLQQGDAAGALAAARQVLAGGPNDSLALTVAGEAMLAMSKFEQAARELRHAVEAQGDAPNPDTLFALAKACQAGGMEQEAQQRWQQFLAVEPASDRTRRVRQSWVVLRTDVLPRQCRAYPAWSPDGSRIMFGYGQPRIVHLQTGDVAEVRSPDGEKLFNHCWSPDGRQLLCRRTLPDGKPGLFLFDLAPDGGLTPTTDGPICIGVMGRFSPDGTTALLSAAAVRRNDKLVPFGLALFDMASGNLHAVPLRDRTRASRNHGTWGPDGRTIVFHAYRHPRDRQLFSITLDEDTPRVQITDNHAMNLNPDIRPDGQTVAFEVDNGEAAAIQLASLNGDPSPLELAKGKAPTWSPDGSRLAYDASGAITICHLGGLAPVPVSLAAKRAGEQLSVTARNCAQTPLSAAVTVDLFDENSVRVLRSGEEQLDIPAGETVKLNVQLEDAVAETARAVKIAIVTSDGKRRVQLLGLGD